MELVEVKLVAVLVLAVAARIPLDGVVGQMHEWIVAVVKFVFTARRAQVSFLKEEHFHVLVDEDPDADVELAFANQQRLLNVLLDDEREVLGHLDSLLHERGRSTAAGRAGLVLGAGSTAGWRTWLHARCRSHATIGPQY